MTSRLHHLGNAKIAGIIRLQVRCDDSDHFPEALERYAGSDTGPLDTPARWDAMITGEGTEQRGLARAVRSVHEPELAFTHGQRDLREHPAFVEVDARIG